jgi:hypothetical protein
MKPISTVRAIAASALFASLFAGCSSWPGDRDASRSGQGGGTRGASESRREDDCELFYRAEHRHTPSTQEDLVDQNMRGMTPEMRERRIKMMREKCGRRGSASPSESKY